jgi:trehalose/maltose hydrolase-like predicted phosphorylase
MHKDINKNLYTNFQLFNVAMDNGLLTMDYLTIQIKLKKSRLKKNRHLTIKLYIMKKTKLRNFRRSHKFLKRWD